MCQVECNWSPIPQIHGEQDVAGADKSNFGFDRRKREGHGGAIGQPILANRTRISVWWTEPHDENGADTGRIDRNQWQTQTCGNRAMCKVRSVQTCHQKCHRTRLTITQTLSQQQSWLWRWKSIFACAATKKAFAQSLLEFRSGE